MTQQRINQIGTFYEEYQSGEWLGREEVASHICTCAQDLNRLGLVTGQVPDL